MFEKIEKILARLKGEESEKKHIEVYYWKCPDCGKEMISLYKKQIKCMVQLHKMGCKGRKHDEEKGRKKVSGRVHKAKSDKRKIRSRKAHSEAENII